MKKQKTFAFTWNGWIHKMPRSGVLKNVESTDGFLFLKEGKVYCSRTYSGVYPRKIILNENDLRFMEMTHLGWAERNISTAIVESLCRIGVIDRPMRDHHLGSLQRMAEARTRYEKETNIARDILILGLLPNKVKTLVNEMRKKVVVVDGKVRFRA